MARGGEHVEGITVLKVGGAEVQEGQALDGLLGQVERLARQGKLVVVHGGGAEIADLQQKLGLQACFVDGLRVTDGDSLRVAQMVLSGLVNKRLTARLVDRGIRALGLSGVDGGLLRARRLQHPRGDLGFVGEVVCVEVSCLLDLMAAGFTPVISPISLGEGGCAYNVNADHAALAVAGALRAAEVIFLTDVPGVRRDGNVLGELGAADAEELISAGVITGGMIPKVRSALEALRSGVGRARITDLAGLAGDGGTLVIP